MRMQTTVAALGALFLGLPAAAASFTPPQGCTTFLTVQNKSCSVSLQWRCDNAPNDEFWTATYSLDGLESIVSYSGDYQWLTAIYLWDSSREEFSPPAADPISISTLLRSGSDTFDFTMRRTVDDQSYDVRVVGADVLTGETTEIDGYALDLVNTRVEIIADDGTVEYKSAGTQYVSRSLRQFFLGTESVFETDGSSTEYVDRPVDIIEPGEPGFGSTVPLYDCNQLDAGLAPDAGGLPSNPTVTIDKKPHGHAFEGGERRRQMTEADMFAMYAPKDGET